MVRKLLLILFVAGLFIGLASTPFALEKLKWSTAVRTSATSFLPPLTAIDRGFAKENGLELEWVPFTGAAPQIAAMAAGAISIGQTPIGALLPAMAKVPLVIVADLARGLWFIYVKTDSPYRNPRDLKGAKVAVSAIGSASHLYGLVAAKAIGLEKDIRFVGAGSPPGMYASVKAGAVQASMFSLDTAFPMKLAGEIREIVSVDEHLPKPWVDNVAFVRKDFARNKPDIVKKAIRAHLQAISFLKANPRWAADKIKSVTGLSEEGAKALYDTLIFATTGRIDRSAIENARRLFIEYGLITQEAPAVDDLFTNEYILG